MECNILPIFTAYLEKSSRITPIIEDTFLKETHNILSLVVYMEFGYYYMLMYYYIQLKFTSNKKILFRTNKTGRQQAKMVPICNSSRFIGGLS